MCDRRQGREDCKARDPCFSHVDPACWVLVQFAVTLAVIPGAATAGAHMRPSGCGVTEVGVAEENGSLPHNNPFMTFSQHPPPTA